MCGVLFAFEKKIGSNTLYQRGQDALTKLKHRGPDEQKLCFQDNWVIGHTRLSIVDLAGSHQPMISPDGTKYLSFNGEIYNFRELRKKLEHKWKFSTTGDTEVLLAGLTLYGTDFIKSLEGMWAFVLWDAEKQQLFASRDPLGKKPLYFRSNQNRIYFASELTALMRLCEDPWEEDRSLTKSIIKYGFTPPGSTIYRDAYEIKPGHNLEWNPEQEPIQHQYWVLRTIRDSRISFSEACEVIEQKIESAVRKRLIADVDIGAFLSGGIDSSIIATLAQKQTQSQLRTFTVKFTDQGFDESRFARLVAKKIDSRHFEIEASQPTLEDMLELLQNSFGQPFGDPSILPTYSLCKATANHVKVALSGDGADEIFSGYQRYQARVLLNWYLKAPKTCRRAAESIISSLPDSYAHHSKSLIKKAKEFSRIAASDEFNLAYFAPIIIDGVFVESDQINPSNAADGQEQSTSLEEMMHRDMLVYLPQDILTKVDRASMYSSLEVRSPFLDIELIEAAFSLPVAYHRSLLKGKKLLRDIYRERMPHEIIARRKQGFANPIHSWFTGELGDKLIAMNQRAESILSTEAVSALIAKHRSGKKDMSLPLWNILGYLLWKTNASL